MKETKDLLYEAMKASGEKNWSALAEKWGVAKSAMSHYRSGKRIVDDYVAAMIAKTLKINELQVIAKANQEREKDPAKVRYWQNIISRVASVFTVALLTNVGLKTTVITSQYILC